MRFVWLEGGKCAVFLFFSYWVRTVGWRKGTVQYGGGSGSVHLSTVLEVVPFPLCELCSVSDETLPREESHGLI